MELTYKIKQPNQKDFTTTSLKTFLEKTNQICQLDWEVPPSVRKPFPHEFLFECEIETNEFVIQLKHDFFEQFDFYGGEDELPTIDTSNLKPIQHYIKLC